MISIIKSILETASNCLDFMANQGGINWTQKYEPFCLWGLQMGGCIPSVTAYLQCVTARYLLYTPLSSLLLGKLDFAK